MKKTIMIMLAMTLLLSAFASAGFLEWLFGQDNAVTGEAARRTGVTNSPAAVTSNTLSLKGSVSSGTNLAVGTINLPNNVKAKTTYNSNTKTATITLTQTINVKNGDRVTLDDGIYTVSVTSNRVSFSRGVKAGSIGAGAQRPVSGEADEEGPACVDADCPSEDRPYLVETCVGGECKVTSGSAWETCSETDAGSDTTKTGSTKVSRTVKTRVRLAEPKVLENGSVIDWEEVDKLLIEAFQDFCINTTTVLEYACDGNNLDSQEMACPRNKACSNGKCVSTTSAGSAKPAAAAAPPRAPARRSFFSRLFRK